MNEPKKLKRGLRDISPLFDANAKLTEEQPRREPAAVWVKQEPGLRVVSIFSPDFKGERRLLSQMMGLKLSNPDHACSIITIAQNELPQLNDQNAHSPEILNPSLKRICLKVDDLEKICQPQLSREMNVQSSQTILFDFDHYEPQIFERVIPLIDQWIILIQPTLEGVSEAYKLIKASVALNHGMEYFLAIDALPDDSRVGELYEKLSDMVSRRLHVQLNWLGCMPISKGIRAISWDLHLDQLVVKNIEKIDSIEKMALGAYLQPVEKNEPSSVLKMWAVKNQNPV